MNFAGKEKSPILMAECGCVLPTKQNQLPPISGIDPPYILARNLYARYKTQCDNGNRPSCRAPNGTAVARAIVKNTIYRGKYDYISTFSVSAVSGGFNELCLAKTPTDQM
jgi:hypothetical protein